MRHGHGLGWYTLSTALQVSFMTFPDGQASLYIQCTIQYELYLARLALHVASCRHIESCFVLHLVVLFKHMHRRSQPEAEATPCMWHVDLASYIWRTYRYAHFIFSQISEHSSKYSNIRSSATILEYSNTGSNTGRNHGGSWRVDIHGQRREVCVQKW